VKQHAAGLSYFDAKGQREAFIADRTAKGGGEWDVIITDYSDPKWEQGKEYHIRIYNQGFKNKTKVRHCEEWCEPQTPTLCDMFDSLCQPEYISKGKYDRTVNISFGGETVEADEVRNVFLTTENTQSSMPVVFLA
jgi:hypothetical protein